MFKKNLEKIYKKYNERASKNEDDVVLNFIDSMGVKDEKTKYFEVGSGTGRFPEIIQKKRPDFSVKCLEINNDLVNMTRGKDLDTVLGSVLNLPFQNEEFDIVHCSHVIEHFGYPDIIQVFDEIFRVTKNKGCVIIRSPLMHRGFYFDIDHVRPYPPESILNYYNNPQQQAVGKCKIEKIKVWYRREVVSAWFLPEIPRKAIDLLLRILWIYI